MRDWKNADQNEVVCYCKEVDKREILQAITSGARTLNDVAEKTGACTGNECAVKNPSGICCHEDIQAILDIYVPAHEMMGGCSCGCCGASE